MWVGIGALEDGNQYKSFLLLCSCDTMSPVLKIFVGALMMVLGIFTSVTYSNQLLNLLQGGIGPLLVLVGAFIVWLESDEWKMQRQQSKEESTKEIQGQQTLQQETSTNEVTNNVDREKKEAAKEIKQAVSKSNSKAGAEQVVANRTVNEVKDALQDRQDLNAQELLEAERNNQNRKTLVEYLERQVE